MVTVQRLEDERLPACSTSTTGQRSSHEVGEEVYSQTVEGEAFDLIALIRAVNTKKRVRATRGKKETA